MGRRTKKRRGGMMGTLQHLLGRKEASDLEKLARREIELDAQRRVVSADVVAADGAVATKLISSDDVTEEVKKLEGLRSRVRDFESAIAAIRRRRVEVIRDGYLAHAGELRAIAQGKKHDLETLEGQTSKLLASLSQLEEVPFTPKILSFETRDHTGAYLPKSQKIRSEISKLEADASQLERKSVPVDGHVDIDNQVDGESLRLAVLLHGSISPSLEAIDAWLVDCLKGRNTELGTRPRRFSLAWRGGVIDREGSFIFVRTLAPAMNANRAGSGFNTAAGTFTAANRGSRT
jgi:hypothetical protein